MFVLLSGIFITYSIYYDNKYINNYILPILLFINIGVLLLIDMKNDMSPNYIHILSILGLIYLLIIFNYKDFKVNKGILVRPNEQWIYLYIIILIMWYLSSSKLVMLDTSKYINCLLIIYPLLFPINEFFIHRIYSLLGALAINMYISKL